MIIFFGIKLLPNRRRRGGAETRRRVYFSVLKQSRDAAQKHVSITSRKLPYHQLRQPLTSVFLPCIHAVSYTTDQPWTGKMEIVNLIKDLSNEQKETLVQKDMVESSVTLLVRHNSPYSP